MEIRDAVCCYCSMTELMDSLHSVDLRAPEADASEKLGAKINVLRAGVLGANDGVISVAAVSVGVAAATTNVGVIAAAGFAALIGGALSMAIGEYVSVSSQRDALRFHKTNSSVAADVDPGADANPWAAAFASAVSFLVGGILPLAGATLLPGAIRIPLTFVIVFAALCLFGVVSARVGGGSSWRATVRMVVGGAIALLTTFAVGAIFHTSGIVS